MGGLSLQVVFEAGLTVFSRRGPGKGGDGQKAVQGGWPHVVFCSYHGRRLPTSTTLYVKERPNRQATASKQTLKSICECKCHKSSSVHQSCVKCEKSKWSKSTLWQAIPSWVCLVDTHLGMQVRILNVIVIQKKLKKSEEAVYML